MILLEDTRQQEKKHSKKHKYFLEMAFTGIAVAIDFVREVGGMNENLV